MDFETTRISQSRIVNTYAELWDGSTFLFDRAQAEKLGARWALMSCAVLTAFTMEAYLNHVGPGVFANWRKLDREHSPVEKIELLCQELRLSFPADQRSSIEKLFRFRKAVAHGRSETLKPPDVSESLGQIADTFASLPPVTEWEKYCSSIGNVQHAREDVERVIILIQKTTRPNEPAFSKGYATHSITLNILTNGPPVLPR